MIEVEEQLGLVPVSERILLLPHCLRRSATCRGTYSKKGLDCIGCNPDCPVNHLRSRAVALGYKGVCVAPGGRLAVTFVRESRPRAIVAVACEKELEDGIKNVRELGGEKAPVIAIIPLTVDGCVDTETDEEEALRIIGLGCGAPVVEE